MKTIIVACFAILFTILSSVETGLETGSPSAILFFLSLVGGGT
jgi:hypothetical protein